MYLTLRGCCGCIMALEPLTGSTARFLAYAGLTIGRELTLTLLEVMQGLQWRWSC